METDVEPAVPAVVFCLCMENRMMDGKQSYVIFEKASPKEKRNSNKNKSDNNKRNDKTKGRIATISRDKTSSASKKAKRATLQFYPTFSFIKP